MKKSGYSFFYLLLIFLIVYFLIGPITMKEFNRLSGTEGFKGLSWAQSYALIGIILVPMIGLLIAYLLAKR
jgi:Na+/H+ antiporter NhaC